MKILTFALIAAGVASAHANRETTRFSFIPNEHPQSYYENVPRLVKITNRGVFGFSGSNVANAFAFDQRGFTPLHTRRSFGEQGYVSAYMDVSPSGELLVRDGYAGSQEDGISIVFTNGAPEEHLPETAPFIDEQGNEYQSIRPHFCGEEAVFYLRTGGSIETGYSTHLHSYDLIQGGATLHFEVAPLLASALLSQRRLMSCIHASSKILLMGAQDEPLPLSLRRNALFLYDLATGERTQITPDGADVEDFLVSSDESVLVVATQELGLYMFRTYSLIDGEELSVINVNRNTSANANTLLDIEWFRDGESIAYVGDEPRFMEGYLYDVPSLFTQELFSGNEPELFRSSPLVEGERGPFNRPLFDMPWLFRVLDPQTLVFISARVDSANSIHGRFDYDLRVFRRTER